MGKHYGLPVYINAGLTDSKRPDAQAGLECGLTLAFGSAAGADIFGHMGICGMDQASSLDFLVMQNEIISYVESVNRQIEFDESSFAFDIIKEVGPKGNFLKNVHTLKHFRKELWFPNLLNREYYDSWRKKGATSMAERCRERKGKIIATHKPEPLKGDVVRELEEIVDKAKHYLS